MSVTEQLDLRSRRALLAAAAGAAGAAALSGCGSKPLREKIRNGAHVAGTDVALLNSLIDVEHYGIAAYAAGLPLLGPAWEDLGKQLLGQELAHANELSELIKGAGGKPRRPPASYDLGDPRTAAGAVALLERAERAQLHAYLHTIPSLSVRIRATVATIFANDAQHLAVLRQQTGQPFPGPFAGS